MKFLLVKVLAVVLVFAPLFFLCRSSYAQSWVITKTDFDGQFVYQGSDPYNGPFSGSDPWVDDAGIPHPALTDGLDYSVSPGGQVHLTAVGTITTTLKWQNSDGSPGANPPSKVCIKQTPYVEWAKWDDNATGAVSGTGTANDGLGDLQVSHNNPYCVWADSTGSHVVQRSGASGTITVSVHLSGDVTVMVASNAQGTGRADLSIGNSVSIDDRGVQVGSDLGLTFHREVVSGSALQIPNYADEAGTVNADTSVPSGGLFVTYSGAYFGSWNQNSEYHWYSSLGGNSSAGSFNPNPISAFLVTYTDGLLFGTDHTNLHAIDSVDQVQASGNYYLHFHDALEDWTRTFRQAHPNTTTGQGGDWFLLMSLDNPSSSPLTQKMSSKVTLQRSMKGTFGFAQELSAKEIGAFKANEQIEVGKQVTIEVSEETTFTAAPWTRIECYAAQTWEERRGVCSRWDTHGYTGDTNWSGEWVSPSYSMGQVEVATYTH